MYVRFPLSLRNVEDLLHERGIDVSHETIRFWWNLFGPMFAAEIRRNRAGGMRAYSNWQWHLDEVFVKINGENHYLWRAVDHEGEVLESYVTKRRDRKAALKFIQTIIEMVRQAGSNCDRQTSIIWYLDESHWQRRQTRNGPLAEQSVGEFPPAFSTTGTCHASLPTDAIFAEVYLSSFFSSQPFQPRASPLPTGHFQTQPRRRSCRVARSWRGIRGQLHYPCRDWFELV